jgi:3-oxoadipate enol-lactonase
LTLARAPRSLFANFFSIIEMDMASNDAYFASSGARLRFRDEGAGPCVAFVHGWTLDLAVWEPQAAGLSGALRVLRWDRRGFGLSAGVPDLESDLLDLAALLDHAAVPRAALVGASQGARVALAFALRFPERVEALVLDGPPGDIGSPAAVSAPDIQIEEYRELARREGIEAFRRAWRAHPLMQLHSRDAGAASLLDSILARYPGTDLLDPGCAARPIDPRAIARMRTPALVLCGASDSRERRLAAIRIHALLAGAEAAVIPGAGHLPNLDDPRAYNETILAFLRRRSQAAA